MSKEDWSAFVETLDAPPVYHHTDDMPTELQEWIASEGIELPVVLEKTEDGYHVRVDKTALENCDGEPACLINHLSS